MSIRSNTRDEHIPGFTRFPKPEILFLEKGSGSNWWFEKKNILARRFFLIPTEVVSDCPINAQNPNLFPHTTGACGSLHSEISFPAFHVFFLKKVHSHT